MKNRHRHLLLLISVAALAALAGTVTYAVAQATNAPYRPFGGGAGFSMMGAGGTQSDWYLRGSGPVGSIAEARAQAQLFADRLGLQTDEVMQFTDNYYVLLKDAQGRPATEVLVEPQTGDVTLEYGPAMMWNTRYGMMSGTVTGTGGMMGSGYGRGGDGYGGGMMGRGGGYGAGGMMGGGMMGGMMGSYGGSPSWTPGDVVGPVTVDQAQTIANDWLARQGGNLTAAEPDALPGYFTFHVLENGKITGMLSVNEQSGAVFYHWWHGAFIAMEE
jgi:hypothetical protein